MANTGAVEYAVSRRINSVWTVAFVRVEGGAKIIAYSRDLEIGYEKEHELPTHYLVESQDGKRIVEGIRLGSGKWGDFKQTEYLNVVNKKHVFSYGDSVSQAVP